jgi:hypothetical protein
LRLTLDLIYAGITRGGIVTAAVPGRAASTHSRRAFTTDVLIDYCSRPSCRKEFRRLARPGRRREYCSEICRRAAEKELRQARARLAHFEGLVQKLRIDVAAYGKPVLDEAADDEVSFSLEAQQTAENAVRRADGALAFASPDDPAVRELRMLYEAVAPIILDDRALG